MRGGYQARICGFDAAIEIHHARFQTLHPSAELVNRLTELIKLLARSLSVNL